MRSENRIYHLCNLSPKVIFRDEEDYLIAICRLAACAYSTMTEVWAYTFMSTHFHLIVRTRDLTGFIKLLKINLATWHNKKYVNSIRINITKRELNDAGEIRTAVNYVLKNPIHHGIADTVFIHPYSSAHIYFQDKLRRQEYYSGEYSPKTYSKPSEIKARTYRKLFIRHNIPDSCLIIDDKMVLPESFVKIAIIEKLYSNVRDFLFHMNKPLKEELEMFGESGHRFSEQKTSLFGKLTDIQVCKIIDDYIAPRTYTQITCEEKPFLEKLLRSKGVDIFQFERSI